MERKVLISFLGAGKYSKCRYYFDGNDTTPPTRYIQESIIRIFCNDWNEQDLALIFVTDLAQQRNWQNNLEFNEEKGLDESLKGLTQYKNIPIKDGKNESEIWDIFQTVSDEIHEGDEIILDITHAFRFLPMLSVILLNYLKVIKKINVKGIYYGNFEIRDEKGNAPIVDLTSFVVLQEWTNATNEFVSSGNFNSLSKLVSQNEKSQNLSTQLDKFTKAIQTSRGIDIINLDIDNLERLIIEERETNLRIPLTPILKLIENKISNFHNHSIENGFFAVKWCIEHGLTQQGITLLQESILTFILYKLELNYLDKDNRNILSNCLSIKNASKYRYTSETINMLLYEKEKYLVSLFFESNLLKHFSSVYKSINIDYRNDINHAGFRDNYKEADEFTKILEDKYDEIITILSKLN